MFVDVPWVIGMYHYSSFNLNECILHAISENSMTRLGAWGVMKTRRSGPAPIGVLKTWARSTLVRSATDRHPGHCLEGPRLFGRIMLQSPEKWPQHFGCYVWKVKQRCLSHTDADFHFSRMVRPMCNLSCSQIDFVIESGDRSSVVLGPRLFDTSLTALGSTTSHYFI